MRISSAHRSILLLCCALMGAAGCLVIAATTGRDPRPLDEATPEPAPESRAVAIAAPSGATWAAPERDPVARDAPLRRETPGAVVAEFAVRIVDSRTGTPLPAAAVGYAETAVCTAEADRDVEAMVRRRGDTTAADAWGLVRIPVRERAIVVARCRDRMGRIVLDLEDDPAPDQTLALHRDFDLRVRVVNADGTAAEHMPIAVRAVWADAAAAGACGAALVGRTGPDGVAGFPHFPLTIERWLRAPERLTALYVEPDVIGLHAGYRLDPEQPPPGEVTLSLPPWGRVRVRAVDAAGNPWARNVAVCLQPAGETVAGGTPRRALADADGARFERVAAGRTYVASAQLGGPEVRSQLAGPERAGAEITVLLRSQQSPVVLAGRLLDADHFPLAEAQVTLCYGAGAPWARQELRTDARGSFRVTVAPPAGADRWTCVFRRRGQPVLEAELEYDIVPGENALGDVLLQQRSETVR